MPLTLKPDVAAPKPPGVASPVPPPRPDGGAITPGMIIPSWVKLRPFSGRSTICLVIDNESELRMLRFDERCVPGPSIVMVSTMAPIVIRKSTRDVLSTVTVIRSNVTVRKPCRLAFTEYGPG